MVGITEETKANIRQYSGHRLYGIACIRPDYNVKMVDQYASEKERSAAAFKRWLRPKLLVASYFLMVAISVSVLAIILGLILEG